MGIGHVRVNLNNNVKRFFPQYSSDAELLDSSRFLSPDYGSRRLFPSVEELGKAGQVFPTMEVSEYYIESDFILNFEALGRFPVEVRPILDDVAIDRTAMWLRIKPEYHGFFYYCKRP